MMINVVDMSKATGDGRVRSPEQMLEEALSYIRDPDDTSSFSKAKKMMIISLDDSDECYQVNWLQAGMKMSECVSLCEVAKVQFLGGMEHVVTFENINLALEP
jgi:hypothetical protein